MWLLKENLEQSKLFAKVCMCIIEIARMGYSVLMYDQNNYCIVNSGVKNKGLESLQHTYLGSTLRIPRRWWRLSSTAILKSASIALACLGGCPEETKGICLTSRLAFSQSRCWERWQCSCWWYLVFHVQQTSWKNKWFLPICDYKITGKSWDNCNQRMAEKTLPFDNRFFCIKIVKCHTITERYFDNFAFISILQCSKTTKVFVKI